MGIRETLNEKPAVSGVLAVVVIGVAIFVLKSYWFPSRPTSPAASKQYFSDDDGKTWFIDDVSKVPPFDHGGKEAVRAILFRCGTGQPFVQRLESYEADQKQRIEEAIASGKSPLTAMMMNQREGMRAKLPGDKDWVTLRQGDKNNLAAFSRIMEPHCPDGSVNQIHLVGVEENAKP